MQCCSVFEELWIQRKSILFMNAICKDIDGLRDCYIEWSKLERERQLLYDTTYMWNLKKNWYKWTYLQNRNRVTNVGKKKQQLYVYQRGKGQRVKLGDWGWHIHSTIYIYLFWHWQVAQSCLTFCNPMDCSLPGSSVHGIFQARVLE